MKNFSAHDVGNHYLNGLLLRENQEEWVWYHCYNYFSSSRWRKLSSSDYNMLSLHLSVYLGQANMYHGSSFILQNGYKVHREAIQLICSPKYHALSGISCLDLGLAANRNRLFELTDEITTVYHKIRQHTYARLDKREPASPVSQNLITKVLLGTLGCVPAFDSRALSVFKQFELGPKNYSSEAVLSLIDFYQREEADFNQLADIMYHRQITLPQMKLIDIILQHAAEKERSVID
ncbi:hypothetical protein I6N95_19725 [Vagococcus sp. BWB3-3]|uniref:Uncharacterized protein n=1 Tax=Vagococcus allomyrinae TaxID=2794353 RepID=A0A940PE69_9ENTE|nr:hypothetical protein [Vagococcus allomyrinae]MBP1043254.1 hypothetical protein [Vagococcus allomyrinae]